LTIDAGIPPLRLVDPSPERLIFTIHSASTIPRMTADVYAVANKGFRWEIKS
jgi:hypothetical protein